MTLTLTVPTAIALINSIVDPLDAGATGGDLLFTEANGTDVRAHLTEANVGGGNVPLIMFDGALDEGGGLVSAQAAGVPWEDNSRTVSGDIFLALFRDGDDSELFRCDVGPGGEDIQMSNRTVSNNDPVRLTSYALQVMLVN